ncbi:MAG: hypothetical protein AAGC77_13300, partial [Pseudomonadota bacterium]
ASFYSQSAGQVMNVTVQPYEIVPRVMDGARAITHPLPPEFIDLPVIVNRAALSGYAGAINRAGLRVYPKIGGAAWSLYNRGRQRGKTYAASTGAPIEGDVTGFVDQYNADWAYAAELWRNALSQYRRESETDSLGSSSNEKSRAEQDCDSRLDATWSFGRCNVHSVSPY